jgi:RHH-type rel operon transcriptional repressor/antitoxin RelB
MYSKVEIIMLALRLPPDIEKRLDALARKTGRTKSYYAREAIMRQIKDIEEYYLAKGRRERSSRKRPVARHKSRADDAAWLRALSETMTEWSSPADAKAYDDL